MGDPYAVYREIFAGGDMNPNADPAARSSASWPSKKSMLDYVGGALERLQERAWAPRTRTPSAPTYQSIRELETAAAVGARPPTASAAASPDGMIDIDDGASYPLILKAHLNLMVAALKCGVTNVATLQTGDSSGNNINFAFVPGIPARSKNNYKSPFRNWHDLGHNPVMDGVDHKRIVDKWFMERWAELVRPDEGDPRGAAARCFDNTLILIGNHVEDGGSHNSNAIPWMLAGARAAATASTWATCVSGGGSKVANVMAGMCGALGIDQHPYGAALNGMLKA